MGVRTLKVAVVAAMVAVSGGCGDDDGGPDGPVIASVEVTPATAGLFTVAPGNTVQLTAVARDESGAAITGLTPEFESANPSVATVADDGTVTAVGAGTTELTASFTSDGETETGSATVTVEVAPATAAVTGPGLAYLPPMVHVSAGGTVTWTFANVPHDVDFTTAGAPDDAPVTQNASVSRTFPTSGVYEYLCNLHAGMTAAVTVH